LGGVRTVGPKEAATLPCRKQSPIRKRWKRGSFGKREVRSKTSTEGGRQKEPQKRVNSPRAEKTFVRIAKKKKRQRAPLTELEQI